MRTSYKLQVTSYKSQPLDEDQVLSNGTPGLSLKFGEGLAGSVGQSKTKLSARAPNWDYRYSERAYGEAASRVREVLALPICDMQGELKGVLELVNRSGGRGWGARSAPHLSKYATSKTRDIEDTRG